jgi:hydroxyacylglutathione hydrolase
MDPVFAVPAFRDNYIWVLTDDAGETAVAVDPGDAAPVWEALERRGLRLGGILVTHHHADHVGGVTALLEQWPGIPVWGPAGERIPGRTVAVADGDEVVMEQLGLRFEVLDVPGHTAGHVAYFGHGMLFCGDTLFAGGCGRLFEGSAAQMNASLAKLARLPGDTRVYCAHEYTEANLRFAMAVEPDNAALQRRYGKVRQERARGEMTLPSTLAEELATNPFLRCEQPSVRQRATARAGRDLSGPEAVFATVRAWKDSF